MNIRITLTGTSPLLMHNPQMVDPDYELNRQIKALTSKKKKTDEDLKQIEKLEWYGGLYAEIMDGKNTVVQPTSKVRKCLINAAKIRKMGKTMERAISFANLNIPLIYDGPTDINELFKNKDFHSKLSVVISGKRIMRVRPRFSPWKLTLDGIFMEDAGINFDEFEQIAEQAGLVEGIGDNRVNGYGRFTVKIEKLNSAKVPAAFAEKKESKK